MPVTTRLQSRARVVAAIKSKTTKLGQSTSAKSVGTKTSRPGRSHARASLKTTLKEAPRPSKRSKTTAKFQNACRKKLNDKKRPQLLKVQTASKKSTKETGSYKTAKGSKAGADESSEKRTLGYVFILQKLDSMRNETDFYKIEFSEEQPNDNDFGSEFKRIPDSEPIKVLCINKVKDKVTKFLKAVKDTCPYEDGLYKVSPTVFDTFMVQYNKCIEPYKSRD